MIDGTLYCEDNRQHLLTRVRRTTSAWERMRGLLGRPPLTSDEGLLIVPCSSVHTVGMKYPIDLIFMDKHWHIVRIVHALKPCRISIAKGAAMVVETMAGTVDNLGLKPGMILNWKENV